MRKLVCLILVLVIMSILPTAVYAAGVLSVSSETGSEGEMVYLSVVMNESVAGDTVGISYSFDTTLLEVKATSCSWEPDGMIADFSKASKTGVWASSSAVDLQGTLCTLAFRIRKDATFSSTEVNCTVLVKKNTEVIGEYTASGVIYMECVHSFADWKNAGELGHTRMCSKCQRTQTSSHNWDNGKIIYDDGVEKQVITCTVCGAERFVGQSVGESPTQPQKPDISDKPTFDPTNKPQEDNPSGSTQKPTIPGEHRQPPQERDPLKPINPTTGKETPGTKNDADLPESIVPPYRDYNAPAQEEEEHQHAHSDTVTIPVAEQEEIHQHTHSDTETTSGTEQESVHQHEGGSVAVLLILTCVTAVLIVALCLVVANQGKNKKRR